MILYFYDLTITKPQLQFYYILFKLRINLCGSFKTCYVQKHGTEIIEFEVWPYIATFSERESVKDINVLWSMATNVQYTSRNTNLAAF